MIIFTGADTPLVRALHEKDIHTLRKLAFSPGGYGSNEIRKEVWPLLVAAKTNVILLDGKGYNHSYNCSLILLLMQIQLYDGTETRLRSCSM